MKGAPDSIIERLRGLDVFTAATDDELQLVTRLGTPLTLPAGKRVFAEDAASREAIVILRGCVAIEVDGEHVADVGAGQSVGELGLIERRTRNATVTTTEETEVLVFDPSSFSTLLATAPHIAANILRQVHDRQDGDD